MSEPLPPTITVSVQTAEGWAPEGVRVVLAPGFADHLAAVARDTARNSIAGRLVMERDVLARTEVRLDEARAVVASLERALAELEEAR